MSGKKIRVKIHKLNTANHDSGTACFYLPSQGVVSVFAYRISCLKRIPPFFLQRVSDFFSRFCCIGRKEGRKEGRQAGRQAGREGGREEGRKEGRQAGRQAGRQGGREGGREGGRKEGRKEAGGREEGRKEASKQARKQGSKQASEEGRKKGGREEGAMCQCRDAHYTLLCFLRGRRGALPRTLPLFLIEAGHSRQNQQTSLPATGPQST